MQVQELNELASWFKKNVLDIGESDNDVEVDALEDEDHDGVGLDDAVNVNFVGTVEYSEKTRKQDELSLLEFIVGIDNM